MAADFHWDDQAVADLRRLYADGVSTSEIAIALGCPTKNAVVGKVHRLGIARPVKAAPTLAVKPAVSRPLPGNIARKAKAPQTNEAKVVAAEARKISDRLDATVEAPDGGVLFLERGFLQCAMPLSGWDDLHVTEKRVCGAPVVMRADAGLGAVPTSWCRACTAIVSASPSYRSYRERELMKGLQP